MFQIHKVEVKQSKTGKEFKTASITDEQGVATEVSVWPDFTKYAEVVEGGSVVGKIRDSGKYHNLVDFIAPLIREVPSFKSGEIKRAQERKEDSIKEAGANRDSTLLITSLIPSLYKDFTEEELKTKWHEWKTFFSNGGNIPF